VKTIYALLDPVTQEARYVGATSQPLSKRLACHLFLAKTATYPCALWLRALVAAGLRPLIVTLSTVEDDWQSAERQAISDLRSNGANLLNVTLGGLGMLGARPSGETNSRRSTSLKRHYEDPAEMAKRRELGRKVGSLPQSKLTGAANAKALWADPERSALAKTRMSTTKKERLADPAALAAFVAKMKAARAAKKASA
jgi:hypothetical protein